MKTKTTTPSLASIPAGAFTMGDTRPHGAQPPHRVTLTQPFQMAKYQATQKEYNAFCDATGLPRPAYTTVGDRYPATRVSYDGVLAYCAWLNSIAPQKGLIWRLPTEAEWEYACRAGSTTAYSSGDTEADLAGVGWYRTNSGGRLHEVGEKPANAFVLYDMHGNVWEWCEDAYGAYPKDGKAQTDPFVAGNAGSYRARRGGSFWYTAENCTAARRCWIAPSNASDDLGFRVCLGLAIGQFAPGARGLQSLAPGQPKNPAQVKSRSATGASKHRRSGAERGDGVEASVFDEIRELLNRIEESKASLAEDIKAFKNLADSI